MGIKVEDKFYNEIKEKYGSISEYLQKAIDFYENNKVNVVNSNVNDTKGKKTYNEVHKQVDALITKNKTFFRDFSKKPSHAKNSDSLRRQDAR